MYRPYTTRLPVTEAEWQRILSIPLYPGLRDQEQDRVVQCVASFLDGCEVARGAAEGAAAR